MDIGLEIRKYFHNIDNDVDQVRQYYKVTAKDVERDIKILKEWIKKQPHLPQDLEDIFFEKMLLFNKYRVEKAKTSIDTHFTVKTVDRELYKGLENVRLIKQSNVMLFLPTLLPNNEVLIWCRLNFLDPERYNAIDSLQNWIIFYEWAIKYFYVSSIYGVIDMKNVTLGHIKRVNLNDVFKMVKVVTVTSTIRINAIDVINVPSFAVPVINICKGFMRNKLASKVHIYSNEEGLTEKIDLKYLPKDIGGLAESQDEMIKKIDQMIEKDYDHLKSLKDIRSDESKRIGECVLSIQDFGPEGTFKQINVLKQLAPSDLLKCNYINTDF